MTRTTLAAPRARLNWRGIGRDLAPLALAVALSAGVFVAGLSAQTGHADPTPTPVQPSELYGKWDGVLRVDGRPYCLAEWPCYDALVDPAFTG